MWSIKDTRNMFNANAHQFIMPDMHTILSCLANNCVSLFQPIKSFNTLKTRRHIQRVKFTFSPFLQNGIVTPYNTMRHAIQLYIDNYNRIEVLLKSDVSPLLKCATYVLIGIN